MLYSALKTLINANVRQNGVQAITGQVLNQVLIKMVESLGDGYQFKGLISPTDNPSATDQKVFYLATQSGTYTHLGNLQINQTSLIKYDSAWSAIPLIGSEIARVSAMNSALALKADKGIIFKDLGQYSGDTTAMCEVLKSHPDGAYMLTDEDDFFKHYVIKVATNGNNFGFFYSDSEELGVWYYGQYFDGVVDMQTLVTYSMLTYNLAPYAKTNEVNVSLATKADKVNTYTKSQVDSALGNKANSSDVYTRTQVDVGLALKANVNTTYTKTEVDNAVVHKTGNESIGGEKSFNNALVCDDSITAREFILGEESIDDIFATKTELASKVGDLSSLATTDKTSIVNAVNELRNNIISTINADY